MDSAEAREPLPASDARARLSELVDQVTENPGTAVYIAYPDDSSTGAAVLVDSVHYQLLLLKAELADRLGSAEHRQAASK